MVERGSRILLHVTSLSSPYGIGDLGEGAYRFVNFLADANQKFWQILPLNQICAAYGNSPYSRFSVFAGNTLLIIPDLMVEEGFISKVDIENHPKFPKERVNYKTVIKHKEKILELAFDRNKK